MKRSSTCTAVFAALLLVGCGDDGTQPMSTGPADATTSAVTTVAPDGTSSAPESTTRPSTTASTTSSTPLAPTTEPTSTEPMTTEPTATTATEDTMTTEPTETAPAEGSTVDQAIADLAARLGVDRSAIEIVSVEEVDWPDGSIGCPQPGMVYTQAIVNGSKIVLRHDDVEYAYHQGGGRDVFYCPADRAEVGTPPPPTDLDT